MGKRILLACASVGLVLVVAVGVAGAASSSNGNGGNGPWSTTTTTKAPTTTTKAPTTTTVAPTTTTKAPTTTTVAPTTTTKAPTTTTVAPTTTTVAPASCARSVGAGGSVQSAVNASSSGQSVCITGATTGDVTMKAGVSLIGQGGSLTGMVYVPKSATDVTIRSLTLVGTGSSRVAPLQVNALRFQLLSSDVTNKHQAQSCITLGGAYASYGRADNAVLDGNRIHDCGIDDMHDHGIYIEGATGSRLTHNTFTGNKAWGIQLYPDADSTYIGNNTITGNGRGLIFAGEGTAASDNDVVELNVIASSTLDSNVESYWGGTVGVGNVLRNNCIYSPGGGQPNVDTSDGGFTQSGTVGAGSCTGMGA